MITTFSEAMSGKAPSASLALEGVWAHTHGGTLTVMVDFGEGAEFLGRLIHSFSHIGTASSRVG